MGSSYISGMSPVPVVCVIPSNVVAEQTITVNTQEQKIIADNTVFDSNAVQIKITPDTDMKVGSPATLSLDLSTAHDYQKEFK